MEHDHRKTKSKILIIDDDVNATRLMESILSKEGYLSTSINISKNALSSAVSEIPDLILLDLVMPDLDGIELCQILHSDQTLSGVPIIVFTALGNIENKVAAFNAGAKDYITKPVHLEEFKLRIRTWLQSAEQFVYKYELTN